MIPILKIKRLDKDLAIPEYAKEYDSGIDLISANNYIIPPSTSLLVKTGISIELPFGYEGQIRPRSGLALKNSITVLNSPGTIDFQYRGEIGVILINHSEYNFSIKRGDRICQLVICPVAYCNIVEIDELSETDRGNGGFGHTGV